MLTTMRAASQASGFVRESRGRDGMYQLRWPANRGKKSPSTGRVAGMVARLRIAQRVSMGFLDPVEDALFITAGLRSMGVPASFHLGRELAPVWSPAGFYAWVSCHAQVVSTSLPVEEEYVEVYRHTAEPAPAERPTSERGESC